MKEQERDYMRVTERIEREEARDSTRNACHRDNGSPDDNLPWCRVGPHMAEPHDC